MADISPTYRQVEDGTIIQIKLVPRAGKDQIVGVEGESIKIRVHAPAVEGQANAALCKYLAALFGIAKSNVEIITGQTSRHKRVRLRGVTPDMLINVLEKT